MKKVFIVLLLICLSVFYCTNKSSERFSMNKNSLFQNSSSQNYILLISSPLIISNKYLILNIGQNITLTDDKSKATTVTLVSDDFQKALNLNKPFPVLKIQLKNKYVFITPTKSDVANPDDNIIYTSANFYLQESQAGLTPANFASLFLDANNVLSAFFSVSYENVANYNGGITFKPSSLKDFKLIISPIQV